MEWGPSGLDPEIMQYMRPNRPQLCVNDKFSPVAKPQIFGQPCNTSHKVFLLFLYLRDVLFKNLDDATLSPLGNPYNMQIKAAITENLVLVDILVTTHGIKIILVSIHMF